MSEKGPAYPAKESRVSGKRGLCVLERDLPLLAVPAPFCLLPAHAHTCTRADTQASMPFAHAPPPLLPRTPHTYTQVEPVEVMLRAGIKAFGDAMPLPADTTAAVLTPHVDMFVQNLARIYPTVSKVLQPTRADFGECLLVYVFVSVVFVVLFLLILLCPRLLSLLARAELGTGKGKKREKER